MADSENFECRFANACSYALARFDLGGFKEKQSEALKELILGRDTFVNLPTGSGKSLIFQAFPIVLAHMESCSQHSIVVVISPLLPLMKDQVNYLQSKGLWSLEISTINLMLLNRKKIHLHCKILICGTVKLLTVICCSFQVTFSRQKICMGT